MNRYFIPFLLAVLFFAAADDNSVTTITITPHIGDYSISVTQVYYLTQEGITEFDVLTISLSFADLRIFDEKGDLDYEIGQNVIIGKNAYRTITVFFREPLSGDYTFTVKYWFLTTATGKPLTGKYSLTLVNATDTTIVMFDIPLTGITETSRASPVPTREEKENSTVFSYQFSEDTTIILTYEPKESIDYTDTETKTFSQKGYSFAVTYPKRADIFLDDIASFINTGFLIFLEETGIPLRFNSIEIILEKEEDTWAAAEYRGEGKIGILLNNTASYPSSFLAHELTHSYIGSFPRYLEEGIAEYFESRTNHYIAPPAPENYIFSKESFFQTYERQFDETVDITGSRYGLALTDQQEALIYAKYSKGTYVVREIASVCGHETVQEMLGILAEDQNCSVNEVLFNLSEGEPVYTILKKYGFDVVPPYAYPAEALFQNVSQQSWWSYTLCHLFQFKSKIRTATPEEITQIKADIERTGEVAAKTVFIVDGVVLVVFLFSGWITVKKVNKIRKENPEVIHYVYFVPVAVVSIGFSYILYEFLFNGYKFRWIVRNVLAPWGIGVFVGVIVVLMMEEVIPEKYKRKYVADVGWSLSFFAVLGVALYGFMFVGVIVASGYVLSLVVLFVIKRRQREQ